MEATRDTLNSIMEFDHVIHVWPDGTVSEPRGMVWAPEINLFGDSEGDVDSDSEADMVADVSSQGWTLLSGWTGQYMSRDSVIMHPSEYIGGNLADHILATPGYYAAVVVDLMGDPDDSGETENVGWAIAYREEI
jgi:hypothetical protein